MHWACAKITASPSTPDSHLLEILLDKVQILVYISLCKIYILRLRKFVDLEGLMSLNFSSNYAKEYRMLQWPLMLITVAVES